VPRPEEPLDPDSPLYPLANALRELRRSAGNPTFETLALRTNYSKAALAAAAGGKKAPSLGVTLAFVRACGGGQQEFERIWREVVSGRPEQRSVVVRPSNDPNVVIYCARRGHRRHCGQAAADLQQPPVPLAGCSSTRFSAPSRPGSWNHSTPASSGTCCQRQLPTRTGANRTSCLIRVVAPHPDEVGDQEVRADQDQCGSAAADGIQDVRVPGVPGTNVGVCCS
jgi:hypothetical protein